MKGNQTKTDRQWSGQQYCRMLLFMFPITPNTQTHALTNTHTHSAADSRALSPITTEHGFVAWWEQTICQVLVDSKQSTVKNALPWPGRLLSPCGGRYNPPSPRRNPSSSFHIGLFFAPTNCRRLRVCCSRLSGCRRFACEAREGATTPRRLSPFTLPTAGETAWRGTGEREGKTERKRESVFVVCEERRIELAEVQRQSKGF